MGDYDNNDLDLDLDYEEPGSPEYNRKRDIRYVRTIKNVTEGMHADEVDEIVTELESMTYNPSNSPENDAELNVLRAKNIIRQKSRLNPSTASYLRYQAQTSGKSLAEVTREYRKMVKKGGNR